jgi:hypothetical protein
MAFSHMLSFCEMDLHMLKKYNKIGWKILDSVDDIYSEKWTWKEKQNAKNVLEEIRVWKCYNSFLSIRATGRTEFRTSNAKCHES